MYSTYSTQNKNRRRYESSEDILIYSEIKASSNMRKAAIKVAAKINRSPESVLSRYWYMRYNRIIPSKTQTKKVNKVSAVNTVNAVDIVNESPSKITLNIKGVEITMVFK